MVSYTNIPAERWDDYCAVLLRWANRPGGYGPMSGVVITGIGRGEITGEIVLTPDNLNHWGTVHGGCLATLCDACAGVAGLSTGYKSVTLNSTMNYLRPAVGKRVVCTARVRRSGHSVCVVDVTVTDDAGRECTTGTYTMFHGSALSDEEFWALG